MPYLNTLKGLGIILVVLGHIKTPLYDWIYSFHMPLFFMAAGMVLKNKPNIAIDSAKRLLVPYLAFSGLGILVEVTKRFLLHRENLDIYAEIVNVLYFVRSGDCHHYGLVLWFLPTLYIARLIVAGLAENKNFIKYPLVAITGLIGSCIYLPWAISTAFACLPWVMIGQTIKPSFIYKYTPLLAVFWGIVLIWYGMPTMNMADNSYSFYPMNILYSVLFVLTLLGICMRVYAHTQFLNYIGKHSLFFFLLHPYTNNAAYMISQKIEIHFTVQAFISLGLLYAAHQIVRLAPYIKNRRRVFIGD